MIRCKHNENSSAGPSGRRFKRRFGHVRKLLGWFFICEVAFSACGCTNETTVVSSDSYILREYVAENGEYADPASWSSIVISDESGRQRLNAWVSKYSDELAEINTRANKYAIMPTTYLYRAEADRVTEYLILPGLPGPGPKAERKLIEIIQQHEIESLLSTFDDHGVSSNWRPPNHEAILRHGF